MALNEVIHQRFIIVYEWVTDIENFDAIYFNCREGKIGRGGYVWLKEEEYGWLKEEGIAINRFENCMAWIHPTLTTSNWLEAISGSQPQIITVWLRISEICLSTDDPERY